MKLIQLLILILGLIGLNARYITSQQHAFYGVEAGTCIDCFDRKMQEGTMYWDGCNFCKCDVNVPFEERCKPIGCFFSPCPKLRAEMTKERNTRDNEVGSNNWAKWTFGRK